MGLHSYPSLFNFGHKAIQELLTVPVHVEEKIDGSQFSFGVNFDGEIHFRSKGADIYAGAPPKMFKRGVDYVVSIADKLFPGYTYRGEYLDKPKHNTLAYDRTPQNHIMIFDIEDAKGEFCVPDEKAALAADLGLETVPHLYTGMVTNMEQFREFLNTESVLGGQKIEGVVAKPVGYSLFGQDKKVLMGKFVSEAFKEVHQGEWRKENPTRGDIFQGIIEKYRTPARFSKAVQHLREAGVITDTPRDIGPLMGEVVRDVFKEEGEAIKEAVFKFAWKQISRGLTAGLPEWYKEKLLQDALEYAAAAEVKSE